MPRPTAIQLDNPDDEQQEKKKLDVPKWQTRDDIKPIVSELIEMFPEKLSHIKPSKIGYVAFSRKRSKNQAKIFGMKPMFGLFANIDYVLSVHLEHWVMITQSEKYVLILHELLHVPALGFEEGEKDYRKCEDHDIKDFSYVLEQYGIHWENVDKIMKTKEAHAKEKVEAKG